VRLKGFNAVNPILNHPQLPETGGKEHAQALSLLMFQFLCASFGLPCGARSALDQSLESSSSTKNRRLVTQKIYGILWIDSMFALAQLAFYPPDSGTHPAIDF
jgi:hypothetical protein